jgi:hypothetical protein
VSLWCGRSHSHQVTGPQFKGAPFAGWARPSPLPTPSREQTGATLPVPNSVRRWAPRRCWKPGTRGQQHCPDKQACPYPVPSYEPVRHGVSLTFMHALALALAPAGSSPLVAGALIGGCPLHWAIGLGKRPVRCPHARARLPLPLCQHMPTMLGRSDARSCPLARARERDRGNSTNNSLREGWSRGFCPFPPCSCSRVSWFYLDQRRQGPRTPTS